MPQPWIIWTNVPITRRKSYYLVAAPDDTIVFRHRHLWPCVEFLHQSEVKCYQLRPSEHLQGDRVESLRADEENMTWQN